MAADFVLGRWSIASGFSVGFSFSWSPGQHPNKGPVFVMLSPDRPPTPEDVKMTILNYAQARSVEGPVYYYGDVNNSCSQTVQARLMGVYFPEFQADWEM